MASPFGLREPLPKPAPPPFGPPSVDKLFDHGLREHPGRLALIDGDRTWTWEQLYDAVMVAAGPLTVDEARIGPRGNSAEMVIGVLAILSAGGVWVGNPPDGWQLPPNQFWDDPAKSHMPASISFTSGTTGSPKSVVHSQHSLLLPGLVSIEVEPPQPGERIGTPLDLSIANVFVLGPLSALLRGSTFVVMRRRFSAGLAVDIATHSVTRLIAVPTMAYDLTHNRTVDPPLLASLDRLILGGSGSGPTVLEEFTKRFGVRPTLSYGLSEAPTGVVRESLDDPIGSGRGFPLPHVDVVIVDPETRETVDAGTEGEVCIRPATSGPWANCWTGTLGYLNEAERTAESFRGDLLHTGDRGKLDTDGALSVTGRLSSLIIRGGKNIDPLTIENAARATDFVIDAAAIGLPDARLGQIIGVAVVLDPTWGDLTQVDELEVTEFAMDLEEQTGLPIDEIRSVQQLPRNAMGKIDAVALSELF